MVVENAFGRLKGRWRCLQKRIDVQVDNAVTALGACVVLHNICETIETTVLKSGHKWILKLRLQYQQVMVSEILLPHLSVMLLWNTFVHIKIILYVLCKSNF